MFYVVETEMDKVWDWKNYTNSITYGAAFFKLGFPNQIYY